MLVKDSWTKKTVGTFKKYKLKLKSTTVGMIFKF